jgi:hypothetical protein
MKKNLLITALFLTFTINLIPIQSHAASEVIPPVAFGIPALKSAGTNIFWSLSSKTAKTKSITCSKNNTITISAKSSIPSAALQLGIIDSENTYHTAGIEGSGDYSYEIPSSGTYKIYCKNSSSSSVTVSITYSFD